MPYKHAVGTPEIPQVPPAEESVKRRRRKRSRNITPDPQAPELLDYTELRSAFGLGERELWFEEVEAVLEEVGLTQTTDPVSGRTGWDAIAVSMLTADPPEPLRRLGAKGGGEEELRGTFNTARALGVGTRKVRALMSDAGAAEVLSHGYWLRSDVERLAQAPTEALLEARASGGKSQPGPRSSKRPKQPQILRGSEVDPLEVAVAHLGPTNSGKTHDALQALVRRSEASPPGPCVYAAPLRMMAQEAHAGLVEQLGQEKVGLITGDEKVNVEAPVLCTTTELAPHRGDLLCLDEVQWCADPDRGPAWTQRMLNGEYREMRLIGSPDTLPVLRSIFGAQLEVRAHKRLVPVRFIGAVDSSALEGDDARTIVIAFRRSVVLGIAGALQARHPDTRIAVLYGAMPLEARREQIRRMRDGGVQLGVASDVLGHGVNLPCDRILFAETTKYDGRSRRPLFNFEIAQIAGRAGRFGLSEAGQVGVLTGIDYLKPDPELVEQAMETSELIEGMEAHRRLEAMVDGPRFEDLGCDSAADLSKAIRNWFSRAGTARKEGVAFESAKPMLGRLEFVDDLLRQRGSGLYALTIEDAWKFARSRLSTTSAADRDALVKAAVALDDDVTMETPRSEDFHGVADLATVEYQARYIEGLRWCANKFPQLRLDLEELNRCESVIAGQFGELLADLTPFRANRCKRCSRTCAPVHHLCADCAQHRPPRA
jgi:ATP-dependent RNA helicase SUPV3L1/SUV3